MKQKSLFLTIAFLAIFFRTFGVTPPTISLQPDEIADVMTAKEIYAYFGSSICSLIDDLPKLIQLADSAGLQAYHLHTLQELVARDYTTAPAYIVKAAVEEAAACIAACKANISAQEVQRIADALEAYDHTLQIGAADLVIADPAYAQDSGGQVESNPAHSPQQVSETCCGVEGQTRGTKKFSNIIVRNHASIGSLFVGGNEIINHNLTVNNDLRVRGNEIIDGNLVVGDLRLTNTTLVIPGDLKVVGNIKLPNVNPAATQGILQLGVDPIYLYNAGASNFFAGDYTAGVNSTASGSHNISIGTNANTALTTVSDTIAVGRNTVVSGERSIAIGVNSTVSNVSSVALGDNCTVTGDHSIAIGTATSAGNNSIAIGDIPTTPENNALAIGRLAQGNGANSVALGFSSTASNGSCVVGFSATGTGLNSSAVGPAAVAAGNSSVALNVSSSAPGSQSVAIGRFSNAQGSNSIALGLSASSTGTIGAIAIGNTALARRNDAIALGRSANATTSSNSIAIGTNVIATTSGTFIGGIFGANTNATGTAVFVDSSGHLGTTPSSRRFKENFRNLDAHSAQLYKLKPVKFDYKAEQGGAKDQFGLIAEEVALYLPELIVRNAQGEIYSVQYHALPSLLLNEVQHHQQAIEAQSNVTQAQRINLDTHQDSIDQLYERITQLGTYNHPSNLAETTIDQEESVLTRGTKKFDNVIVRNQASVGSLFVGGDEIVNHNLTVNNDLYVKGNEIIDGSLIVLDTTTFTGTTLTAAHDLKVLGNIKLPNVNPAATQGILQLGVDPIYLYNAGTSNFFAGDYTTGVNSTVSGSHNISLGTNANTSLTTPSDTIAVGRNTVVSGERSIAIGANSTVSNVSSVALGDNCTVTGDHSIAIGTATSTGVSAVAIGEATTASTNFSIAIGSAAQATGLASIAVGNAANSSDQGCAIGATALSTGFNATAIGSAANATGSRSVAWGDSSRANGLQGIAIGRQAIAQGDNSIALGLSASSTGTIGAIAIGDTARAENNDTIALGRSATAVAFPNSIAIGTNVIATTSGTFIGGIFGANTNASGTQVFIDSSGHLGTTQSSRRFKENFRNLDVHSAQLYKLKPVKFDYKAEQGGAKDQFGLIAEEVAPYLPELIVRDAQGEIYSVQYHALPSLLLNEVQHHQQAIEAQSKIAQVQQYILEDHQHAINRLCVKIAQLEATLQSALRKNSI